MDGQTHRQIIPCFLLSLFATAVHMLYVMLAILYCELQWFMKLIACDKFAGCIHVHNSIIQNVHVCYVYYMTLYYLHSNDVCHNSNTYLWSGQDRSSSVGDAWYCMRMYCIFDIDPVYSRLTASDTCNCWIYTLTYTLFISDSSQEH